MNMFNNFFNYPFKLMVVMLLPPELRKVKMIGYVESLISGTKSVHSLLLTFREKANKQVLFSGSRIVFEHYVNDLFDTENRSITIENNSFLDRIVLYKHIEGRPLRIYQFSEGKPNPRLYKLQEYEIEIHFLIKVPVALNLTDLKKLELKRFIDTHKLPNKNYIIQYV